MSKATIQDVTDAGFRGEQFGMPADWATADTGYVGRILSDATVWVTDGITAAAYAAAVDGSIAALRIKRAELCYAKAELWRRRAAFLDGNAFSSLEGNPSAARERESYLKHAADADLCAQYNVDLIVSDGNAADVGGGAVLGFAETDPFAASTPASPYKVLA